MAAKKKASKKKAAKKKKATSKKKTVSKGSISEHQRLVRMLTADINEAAECKVIVSANEAPNPYGLRRPSGIMPLDIDTAGGFPAGDLCYISGPQGSCKSYLAMLHAKLCQRIYNERATIAWAPVDGGFDFERADDIGLAVERPQSMIDQEVYKYGGISPERLAFLKHQIGTFDIVRGNTGEQILQSALELIKSGLYHMVIVDSISALLPNADAPRQLVDNNKMAAHATLMTDFMKHYMMIHNGMYGMNETTTIFISEVRANHAKALASSRQKKYMQDYTSNIGAWSARHAKSIAVELSPGQALTRQINKEKVLVGKQLTWKLIKGRHGTHEGKTGDVSFYFAQQTPKGKSATDGGLIPAGVDIIDTVVRSGMKAGVIFEQKNKVHARNPETKEPIPDGSDYPSYANLAGAMRANLKLELDIRQAILKANEISCLYFNEEDEQLVLGPYI